MSTHKFLAALARKLLEGTGSELFLAQEALEFFSRVHKRAFLSSTLYRGPLSFGDALEIPIHVYTRTMQIKLPTAKKMFIAEDGQLQEISRQFRRQVANDAGDEEEVEKTDLAKIYPYGASSITVTAEDEELMALKAIKCMSIRGFYAADAIPRQHFLSNVLVVEASPNDKRAESLFTGFLYALIESKLVAAVRYVRAVRSNPKIGNEKLLPYDQGFDILF